MGKANANLDRAAQAIAAEYGIKPSRTVKGVRALASAIHDVAPRKGSEGRRPTPVAPEVGEVVRRVVPIPSWVYVETTARWGVVMQDENRIFVTSAEPDENGRIDLTTILPKGKVVGVCGYWRHNDDRFPSVNWKRASYGLNPWEVALGVTTDWTPELDTLWYEEVDACNVNFWF